MRTLLGVVLIAVLALSGFEMHHDNRPLRAVAEFCPDPQIGGLTVSPATAELDDLVTFSFPTPASRLPYLVARARAGDCAAFLFDVDGGTVTPAVTPAGGSLVVSGPPRRLGNLVIRIPLGMLPRTYDVCSVDSVPDCGLLVVEPTR